MGGSRRQKCHFILQSKTSAEYQKGGFPIRIEDIGREVIISRQIDAQGNQHGIRIGRVDPIAQTGLQADIGAVEIAEGIARFDIEGIFVVSQKIEGTQQANPFKVARDDAKRLAFFRASTRISRS